MVNELDTQEEVMNIQEAAAFMRCGVSTMYKDSCSGLIPCIRRGSRVLFLRSQLIDWLKSQSVANNSIVITK